MTYVFSDYGLKFLTTEETFAPKAHNNDGPPTYGFGATRRADGSPVQMGDTISREDAAELVKEQVIPILRHLWSIDQDYTQYEVDALTSLLFNCGVGITGPTHTLGQEMAKGVIKNSEAIANAILLYDNATVNGVRGPFLATRRKAESDMFRGEPEVSTPSGTFQCAPANLNQGANS